MTEPSVPSTEAAPDSAIRLAWQASPDYQLVFVLNHGADGNFIAVACAIRSRQVDFSGDTCPLPLQLATKDRHGRDVSIRMQLAPGHGAYAGAVWCDIKVPGYSFEGHALAFSGNLSGPAPYTIW